MKVWRGIGGGGGGGRGKIQENNLALVLFERNEVESGYDLFARLALALKRRQKRHWFGKQLHGKSEKLNNMKLCRIKRLFKPTLGTVT